jgi:DNA replication protein DnaC
MFKVCFPEQIIDLGRIVSSQLPVLQWHEIIGENTIADARLDRIVHQVHPVELSGESMRKYINNMNTSLGETN